MANVDMVRVVCPLCVQWRCAVTHKADCPDDMCEYDHEQEPYWPDGSVAVITQDEYCDSCEAAVAEYGARHDEF